MTDRRLYALSGLLVASGLVHLVVWLVLGGPWTGPVSWRKPFTFGLAFGVTLATVTWVTGYVPLRSRPAWLAVFAAACVAEVAVITVQAWRGVASHFNLTTPVDAAFAYTAAGGGAVIIGVTVVFTVAAWRANPAVAPSMRLAVRAGFASFAVALLIGAAMIAIGVVQSRTVSLAAAYAATGNLKSGHAATMHGILVLPVLAWLAARTGWSEARRVRLVALGCAAYLLGAGAVVVETALGVDVWSPSPGWVPVAVGAVGLLVAGVMIVGSVRGRQDAAVPAPNR